MIRRGSRICSSILVLCAATVATAWVPGALAQDYPNRSIRLLVGFPAGGPSDVPARIIAKKMQVALGQPVVVENKTGAAGMIGRQPVLHRSSALHGGSVRCASLIAPYA